MAYIPQRGGDRVLGRQAHHDNAFAVVRERKRTHGEVIIPERTVCQACANKLPVQEMARIPTTGVVANVQDCICIKCAKSDFKEFSKVSRIVCAGCREVVVMVEPFKERTGFVWQPGHFYHVAECPTCTKQFSMEKSYIAEKIWFYKKYGIPYE